MATWVSKQQAEPSWAHDERVADDYLVCRAAQRLCAVPLKSIVEVMRPMPIDRLGLAAGFVTGVALVRGNSLPVIDLGYLLRGSASNDGRDRIGIDIGRDGAGLERFVCLKLQARQVVLAVEAVLGIRSVSATDLQAIPPLLEQSEHLEALLRLDRELCSVLNTARVLELLPALDFAGARQLAAQPKAQG